MNKHLDPIRYLSLAIRRSSFLTGPIIKKIEKSKLYYYGNAPLKHQPIFIIGAPRTGSTILYQALTNIYDVLFIDNITSLLNKNLFFGFYLSKKIFKDSAHNNYVADHGNTLKYGLHAPSECGHYWYRWLPKDHHFIDYDEINDDMVAQIRMEISAVINRWCQPFVFKNLNAGQRLRLISRVFPDAKLIYIKRDPFYTVQSIYLSRKQKRTPENKLWSVKPPNHLEIERFDEIPMICAQVYYIEKQIETDLSLFKAENCSIIAYEKMIIEGQKLFDDMAVWLQIRKRNMESKLPTLYDDNKVVVTDTIKNEIEASLRQYEW